MINLPPEVEATAKQLAAARGLTIEDAVRLALEQITLDSAARLAKPRRDTSPAAVEARRRRTKMFVDELAKTPLIDDRSANAIADDINAL